MKTLRTIVLTGALAGSMPLLAGSAVAAQSRTIEGESISVTVTIEAIEK